MAYALKVIGRISRADLDIIRFLRNEFAHSRIPFDFNTPEVRAVCDKIKIVDLQPSTIPHGYIRRGQIGGFKAITDLANPKTRFITACHNLSYRMLVKKDGIKPGDFVFPDDDPLP